jgi:hypothetical protein
MNYSRILLATMMAGTLALTGCGGSDDDPVFITVNSSGGAGGSGGTGGGTDGGSDGGGEAGACGDIGEPNGTTTIDGTTVTLCRLPGTINEDTTLSPTVDGAPVAWNLDDRYTYVGNGQANIVNSTDADNITLTIEAGTQFRSSGRGSLVITRGSDIVAQGTEQDPIVMASVDDNFDGRSEWGGLVVQGFAQHNECQAAPEQCNILGEGGVGFFGGDDNGDNSGTIQYLIVAEGGFEVNPGNEINGITLMGVGSGTTIDHIQVHNNGDDGIEFFGGLPNVKYMVLTGNEDDSIDWDEGFQGNIQYTVVVHTDAGDYGMETDNNGSDFEATPRSKPTLANITTVGLTGVSTAGAKHREGTGAYVYNSIYSGFDACLDVDGDGPGGDNDSVDIIDSELIYENVIFDCAADLVAENENGGGNDYGQAVVESATYTVFSTVGGSGASGGVISGSLDTSTYAWDTAAEANSTATGGAEDFTASDTADTSFLDQTSYIGAVDPDSPTAWWDGWIVDGSL